MRDKAEFKMGTADSQKDSYSMKVLKELVQVVKSINLKSTDLILTDNTKETKTQQFYNKIATGDFQTDMDAAQFLFNDVPSRSSYKVLKKNLRDKLISTLFFYELKEGSNDYGNALFYCSKNLLAARILQSISLKDSAIDLYQKVVKKALEVEFTEYVVYASRHLRIEVGTKKGDIEKFNYYNDLYKKHKLILDAEILAEEYYNLLVLPYTKSKEKREDTYKLAKEYKDKLQPFLDKYSSPYLHMIGKYIEVVGFLSINDYKKTIELCEEALIFFGQKKYSYNTPLRIFSHSALTAYIQLKDYEKGKIIASLAINSVRVGERSWYLNHELYLILALHSQKYNDSYQILETVVNSKNFSRLQNYIKERWQIHKVYIDFLLYIKKITIIEKKKIRVGKFLNSVPIYSKDKRGLNIPILIVQLLFLIVKKDYDQSLDKFEAIKKYCSRYLRKGDNLRSNCFINMLLQIPKSGFHKAGVIRNAQKYYDQLLATPLEVSGQSLEIEIIPYEDLWAFILESLDTKRYKGS